MLCVDHGSGWRHIASSDSGGEVSLLVAWAFLGERRGRVIEGDPLAATPGVKVTGSQLCTVIWLELFIQLLCQACRRGRGTGYISELCCVYHRALQDYIVMGGHLRKMITSEKSVIRQTSQGVIMQTKMTTVSLGNLILLDSLVHLAHC